MTFIFKKLRSKKIQQRFNFKTNDWFWIVQDKMWICYKVVFFLLCRKWNLEIAQILRFYLFIYFYFKDSFINGQAEKEKTLVSILNKWRRCIFTVWLLSNPGNATYQWFSYVSTFMWLFSKLSGAFVEVLLCSSLNEA